jgi:hypothetical protein
MPPSWAASKPTPTTFAIFGPDGNKKQGDIAYFPPMSRIVNLLFGQTGGFAYLPDFAGRLTFDVKELPAAQQPGQEPTLIYAQG